MKSGQLALEATTTTTRPWLLGPTTTMLGGLANQYPSIVKLSRRFKSNSKRFKMARHLPPSQAPGFSNPLKLFCKVEQFLWKPLMRPTTVCKMFSRLLYDFLARGKNWDYILPYCHCYTAVKHQMRWYLRKSLALHGYPNSNNQLTLICWRGAVAEWAKALFVREKIRKRKTTQVCPQPAQYQKNSAMFETPILNMPSLLPAWNWQCKRLLASTLTMGHSKLSLC